MAYFNQILISNASGQVINPAQQEDIILLRRMIKLMESQSATDIANRQKITLDAITGSLTLTTITTVSTVTSVTAVVGITNALPAGTNTIGNVTVGGMDDKMWIDFARVAYNTGLRQKLTFN